MMDEEDISSSLHVKIVGECVYLSASFDGKTALIFPTFP